MNKLQELFDSIIQEQTKTITGRIFRKKFSELGITLSEEQVEKVVKELENIKDDNLTIEIDDEQLLGSKIALVGNLKDKIRIELEDSDIDEALGELSTALSESIPIMVDEAADVILKRIKRNIDSGLSDLRKEREKFESRLEKFWRKPFKLLETYLSIVQEAGADFNEQYRPEAAKENDVVFDVLIRLHARACQIGSEVLALLKSGFADGAHARWRTLHEVTAVALFVAKHGHDVAERYFHHEVVESYKAARQYQEYCEAIGYEPLSEKEIEEIEDSRKALIDRFGKSYKNSYGWAALAVGKNDPTFADIERDIELEKFRPYYKMASHNVHANPKGITFKLGLLPTKREILLAGASNTGLADPAHGTAISLLQITTTLLTTKPNIDALTICSVLMKLQREVGDEFLKAQKRLEKRHERLEKKPAV